MQDFSFYQEVFSNYLSAYALNKTPETLYQPIHYILHLGGKRIRPVLTLMAANAFTGNYELALPAALSIEVFHNFSLIHDDIMDAAPLRRGKPTVHTKWNVNAGILSGDAMLILAYQLFETYQPKMFKKLAKLFSATALQVCEGQQYDIDFETEVSVSEKAYLKMITYKTAVLVGAAMQMGAIVANASLEDQTHMYEFAKNLGIAFQLQDDYLDAFGNPEVFGKQQGGDILENKKTYLYLKALALASATQKKELENLYASKELETQKIKKVTAIFKASKADIATKEAIKKYTNKAFSNLNLVQIAETNKAKLQAFGEQLMHREV